MKTPFDVLIIESRFEIICGVTRKAKPRVGKTKTIYNEIKNHNYRNVIRNSDELCSKKMGALPSI